MKKYFVSLMIATGSIFALLSFKSDAQQPPPGEKIEGVEVLTRGPMHEAYAAPQSLDPRPSPIVPKKPPEPIPEMPPDQKPEGSHVVWITGYWAWDDEHAEYLWISGFWRDVPPGKQFVPGHWLENEGGWQWSSGFWAPETQTEVNYVPPPPPTLEAGPTIAAPAADQFYTPGCWVYVQRKHYWRPGFWLRYRPDLVYVPAHYVWTPAGCVFVDAHWDYTLTRRGLLFCPIRFTANVWTRPGWRWYPRHIVYPDVIVGALFVRVDLHRYCFGDYFGPKFVQHGFVPWIDYRLQRNIPSPLFQQYAWNVRKELNWERDLRKLYDDRRTGVALRPPHTFAQQEQLLRDIAANRPIKVGGKLIPAADVKFATKHVTMVSTITTVDRKVIPLRPIPKAAHAEVIKTIEHHDGVVKARTITETSIVKKTVKTTEPVHVGRIPAIPAHLTTPKTITVPVAPVLPKHIEKAIPKFDPVKPIRLSPKPLHSSRAIWPADIMMARAEWRPGDVCVAREPQRLS